MAITRTYDGKVNPVLHKFGLNSAVATSGEVITELGGATYPWAPVAGILSCISTGTTDKAAGKGIASITVQGLDTNHDAIEENIDLNGTVAVSSVNSYLRVHRAFGKSIGSAAAYGTSNDGVITVDISGTTVAQVSAGQGQTLMAIFSVPRNMEFHIAYIYTGVLKGAGSSVAVDTHFKVIDFDDKVGRIFHECGLKDVGSTHISHEFSPPEILKPKSDLYCLGFPTINDAVITAGFGGTLVHI